MVILVKNIVHKNCVKYLSTLFSKPHKLFEFSINISTACCQIFLCNLEHGSGVIDNNGTRRFTVKFARHSDTQHRGNLKVTAHVCICNSLQLHYTKS